MNKKELTKIVAKKSGTTHKDMIKIVELLTQTIIETTVEGEDVTLVGFGTFSVKNRKGRVGIHPATGKKIEIPSGKHLCFKASKSAIDK